MFRYYKFRYIMFRYNFGLLMAHTKMTKSRRYGRLEEVWAKMVASLRVRIMDLNFESLFEEYVEVGGHVCNQKTVADDVCGALEAKFVQEANVDSEFREIDLDQQDLKAQLLEEIEAVEAKNRILRSQIDADFQRLASIDSHIKRPHQPPSPTV